MPSYLVAVDGGGTKTEYLLANTQGEILADVAYAQSNLTSGGLGLTAFNLREGLRQLWEKVPEGEIEVLVLALAGLDNNAERQATYDVVSQSFNTWHIKKLVILNDTIAALYNGSTSSQAMILIGGTGSNCFGINGASHYSVGGLGHLLSDEGSGFDAGRLALRACVASWDGRTVASSLTSRILAHFHAHNPRELKKAVYNPELTKAEIADLAIIVAQESKNGDQLAVAIVHNCLKQLAHSVITTATKLNLKPDFELVISGSFVANLMDKFTPLIKQTLPQVQIVLPTTKPVHGSLTIAQQIFSGRSEKEFWFFND